MSGENNHRHPWRALLLCMGALFALGVTGCQVDVGGQTLPSPYYLYRRRTVFPTGTGVQALSGSGCHEGL